MGVDMEEGTFVADALDIRVLLGHRVRFAHVNIQFVLFYVESFEASHAGPFEYDLFLG